MFAPEFQYHQATTVAQAVQLLNANPGAKLIAGGHGLIPLLKLRQARLPAVIDISGIEELKTIGVNNGTVRIGALATHRDIESSAAVHDACEMLCETAGGIGDTQVRNRGTIGGNVAHADPGSDWPTVLLAMNAQFLVQGPSGLARRGSRNIAAGDFFTGPLTTALAENEILTAIEMPRLSSNQLAEYAKMAHPASSFAVVGAAVVLSTDGGQCTSASIAVGGLVPAPVRLPSVESALVGQQLTAETVAAAAEQAPGDLGNNVVGDSVYASADYRRAMAAVEIKHALNHAIGLVHG
jgi:carbon-monoxide dehydrogenase medium subunit